MEDEEIIKAVLAGDVEQYAVIVGRYQEIVANLCYKMCGTKFDIEEVCQQVFVELYTALPRFQFRSKLSTFIYRITMNVISKMSIKSNRYVTSEDTDKEVNLEVASPALNVEQQIEQQQQYSQLRKALGRLKPEQRTALVLSYYEDFSYQDIADVMQCTMAKIESLIFRAKKNMNKLLSNDR